MCGRSNITPDAEAWAAFFDVAKEVIEAMPQSYNVAPGADVPVVRMNRESEREFMTMRWGLVPFWAKEPKIGYKMINARSETVREKPAYRKPFQKTRCLLPTTGFYEWARGESSKQPFFIHRNDDEPTVFAGLWDGWNQPDGQRLRSCSIMTTEPNTKMAPIHNRMPVILGRDDFEQWLHGTPDEAAELMKPCPPEWLETYPVSTLVNKPANNDERCVERVDLKTGEVVSQPELF